MSKKPTRKTLPKDLDALLDAASETGDYGPVHTALERCLPDARGGFGKGTLLMNGKCPLGLAQWAIARGTDINAGDTWDNTPLHESASSRFQHTLKPAQLIQLGANVHVTNYEGTTPLHSAADAKNADAVSVLLEHGADAKALDGRGLSPLEFALLRMNPIDFPDLIPVAKALLDAGAEVTDGMRESVKRVARTFEFHRRSSAKDRVKKTAAACRALCTMLGVEPPPRRVVHDGTSPIVATAETVWARHEELWSLLVPSSGACQTVQGEVIRISGRVADEWFRNGGANWDRDYSKMAEAFVAHVASHQPLDSDDLHACKEVVRSLRRDPDSSERLMVWAVEWVKRNPTPITLDKPSYRR